MIVRIVRMHFTEAGVQEFLSIFEHNREAIRAFDGCVHVELLRDLDNDQIFTTISHWRDRESLEKYRQSQLFGAIWGKVKRLFAERTQAFSMTKV